MPASEQLPTYARFYEHSALMGDPQPELEGPPKYHDVVMAEIFIKGDRNTSSSKRVFADDGKAIEYLDFAGQKYILPEKYPVAWKAHKDGTDDYSEGTPLKTLPKLGVSAIRNLHTDGIMCVEDLANLTDSVALGNPGMSDLRKQAKAFLLFMEPDRVQAEKDARAAEMQTLKDQIEEMKQMLAEPKVDTPKRTRRKRNSEGILE